jgi:hypothetical protein
MMKTKKQVETKQTVTLKQTGQSWASFPQPKGWSLQWDETGLTHPRGLPKIKG